MTTSAIVIALLLVTIVCGMSYIASLLDQRNRSYEYVEKHTGLSLDTIIRASRGEIE